MVPAPMGNAYTPGLKVTGRTTVRKTRRLPLTGTVLVKVGDPVTARQVVARTELPGKVYPLNVGNQLSIPSEEVPEAMKKQVGQAVAKDEVLAETRSFFGIFHSDVRSPVAGTIESISKVTGQVILREAPIPVEVTAYVDGKVVEEIPNEGVVVETDAAYVQGIFGLGGEVCAPLRVVAKGPDEILDEGRIDDGCRGHILIGGSQLTLPALRRCLSVGATGVICGGFAYQDIKELLGYDIGVAITGGEKLGTTLMVTEGFGRIDMARATYDLLVRNEGKTASMNGATQIRAGVIRPEVIIPRGQVGIAKDGAPFRSPGDLEAETGEVGPGPGALDIGAWVRCIRAPHFGRIGKVSALPPRLTAMPSETKVRTVEVTLEGGETVSLPRANVELIERGGAA